MATYVLIHGGADSAWHWHLLEPELRDRGHDVVAVDLPCDDDTAGFSDYADAVVGAIGDRTDLVVVAQSLGGFTGPLVCDRVQAELLVLLAGMIPSPGELPQDWWANTGHVTATGPDDDDIATFLHDVPAPLAQEAMRRGRDQSGTPMGQPWPLAAWPDVRTRYLLCRDDCFFPPAFARRHARERLGLTADEIGGSHCVALSRPTELAERLEQLRADHHQEEIR